MKTKLKNTGIPILLVVLATFFIGQGCNLFEGNDDDGMMTDTCNYEGYDSFDNSTSEQINITDAQLSVQYFPNDSNGPNGMAGVEIAAFTSSPTLFFTTNVIAVGETGFGLLNLDSGGDIAVAVQCQSFGTAGGDQIRYDIAYTDVSAEFCVTIDEIVQ